MPKTKIEAPWNKTEWLEETDLWIKAQLEMRGTELNGAIEQPHIRPWSLVRRIPTTQGFYFFKASAPVLSHEPGLTRALFGWRPDCIQTVLAVNPERAWMLMPDESPWLRGIIQTKADLSHWEVILPLYAAFQKEMLDRKDSLLALGILDRRLEGLPEQFEQMLEDRPAMLIGHPEGLTEAQYQQLFDSLPRFRAMCQRLQASGIPETLHHDDFHDGNVFVPQGRYVFSDWGESCVAFPFFTLLVTLRSIAYRFDLPFGSSEDHFQFAPELLHLRDIYLSAWQEYGSLDQLREVFSLAWRVAMVSRTLTWHHVLSHLPEQDQADNAEAVPASLQLFLESLSEKAVY